MNDVWIKADYPIGPFAQQPIEQAVADVLAKAPWAAWQTGEVAFHYDYIDRPEAGTALLALLSPPNRPAPNDGLRYAVPDTPERRTVTSHTVSCPVSISAPVQNQTMTVELECYTSYQGHFPPMNRGEIIPPNSPELRLSRFRKRWRIMNGQYPALWFFWWGRDENGGMGPGQGRQAPMGWDRTPVRNYPIVRDPNVPTQALYPFPGPGRLPNAAITSNGDNGGGGGGKPVISQPIATLANASPAQNQAFLAQQRQQHLIMQQHARAQALAASTAAASAAGQGQVQGGGGNVPLGYGTTPAQMQMMAQQQAQQRLVAQQQQQAAYAQAQQSRGAPPSQTQTPSSSRKPAIPPFPPQAQAPIPSVQREPILDSTTPTADVLDLLTSRQLAMHRLAVSQDCLAPIFDPWNTSSILSGRKRKREIDVAVRSEAVDPRTGESRGGIAGFGREHTLTILGTSAARIAVHAAMGKDVKKATWSLEERKEKLSAMLGAIEKETKMMEKKHEETVKSIQATPTR
ncbi:uncharacterized protein JCM6883_001623 [Sporobolomyces salmoneus]|uniref:uncharacterized protein n=1 Tax=Sporobolomyces salmoneus TaxID=183962 RepID=UPI00316B6E8F